MVKHFESLCKISRRSMGVRVLFHDDLGVIPLPGFKRREFSPIEFLHGLEHIKENAVLFREERNNYRYGMGQILIVRKCGYS